MNIPPATASERRANALLNRRRPRPGEPERLASGRGPRLVLAPNKVQAVRDHHTAGPTARCDFRQHLALCCAGSLGKRPAFLCDREKSERAISQSRWPTAHHNAGDRPQPAGPLSSAGKSLADRKQSSDYHGLSSRKRWPHMRAGASTRRGTAENRCRTAGRNPPSRKKKTIAVPPTRHRLNSSFSPPIRSSRGTLRITGPELGGDRLRNDPA